MKKEKRGLFFGIFLIGVFFFSLGFVNALVVNEGQNVKISVSGLSCNSKTANLVYYEVDSNGDDLISSGSYGLPGSVEFDSSGNVSINWNAVWFEDIDSSDGNNNPDIKFRVECEGSSKESSVLEVLKGEENNFYVSVSGAGLHDGSSPENAMTLSEAKQNPNAGKIFLLLSGNYGNVDFGQLYNYYGKDHYGTSWSSPVTYKPADGAEVIFTKLFIGGASGEPSLDRYLIIDGIKIITNDSKVLPVIVKVSSSVKLKNLYVQGITGEYSENCTSSGILVSTTGSEMHDITVENCEVTKTSPGIDFSGRINNGVIRNNHIHNVHSSGIKLSVSQDYGVILAENNIIHDQNPKPNIAGTDGHHGSGFAVRSRGVILRNNTIYDYGNTRPMTFYWEVFDGAVNFASSENIVGVFDKKERVYQEGSSFTGVIYKNASKSLWVLRDSDELKFVAGAGDIVGVHSGARLKNPTNTSMRRFGGYKDVIIENNLIYFKHPNKNGVTYNEYVEIVDIGNNFTIRNNTFASGLSLDFANMKNGSGLYLYNNLIENFGSSPYENWVNFNEGNNIFGCRHHYSGCGWICYADEISQNSNSVVVDLEVKYDKYKTVFRDLFVDNNTYDFRPAMDKIICNGSLWSPVGVKAAGKFDCVEEGDIFYLDPINGDTISGDGSSENPWGSFESVVNAKLIQRRQGPTSEIGNPTAPVSAGDTLRLRNGYHGLFGNPRLLGWHNYDYITVEADYGHSPILGHIKLEGVSYWRFKGLTILKYNNTNKYENSSGGIGIRNHGTYGDSHHIIIENNNIMTASDEVVKTWRIIPEIQTVIPSAPATSGTFTINLTYKGESKITAPISYDANVSVIDKALGVLSGVDYVWNVVNTSSTSNVPIKDGVPILFNFRLYGDVPLMAINDSNLDVSLNIEETVKGYNEWVDNLGEGIHSTGNYTLIKNNTLKYTYGMSVGGNDLTIDGNRIYYPAGHDGIQGSGNRTKIINNEIKNHLEINFNHDDLIQTFSGILYDGVYDNNTLIASDNTWNKENISYLPRVGGSQGIFMSNRLNNWTLTNNLLVNYHWHGVTIANMSGVVANNTVIRTPYAPVGVMAGGGLSVGGDNLKIYNNLAKSFTLSNADKNISSYNNLKIEYDGYTSVLKDYYGYDFRPLMNSSACNGSINGMVGVAVGALPCADETLNTLSFWASINRLFN